MLSISAPILANLRIPTSTWHGLSHVAKNGSRVDVYVWISFLKQPATFHEYQRWKFMSGLQIMFVYICMEHHASWYSNSNCVCQVRPNMKTHIYFESVTWIWWQLSNEIWPTTHSSNILAPFCISATTSPSLPSSPKQQQRGKIPRSWHPTMESPPGTSQIPNVGKQKKMARFRKKHMENSESEFFLSRNSRTTWDRIILFIL